VDGRGLSRSDLAIALFGDGAWAARTLREMHAAGHRIVVCVLRTHPSDPRLTAAAAELGIPILQPDRVNAAEFVEKICDIGPDLNLSIAYNQIIRRPMLESARLGFLNIHAGKLPFYRGRNIINWAIINGETEIGVTAHFMDEGVDTGDILLQRVLPIAWTDTYGDVLERVTAEVPKIVLESVECIGRGAFEKRAQSATEGTYFCGREEGDEWLDWADTSRNLHNKIRAISRPGPGARTIAGGRNVVVWSAFYDPAWPKYLATAGQVVGRVGDGVVVKTGDSTILVREVEIGGVCEKPSWPVGMRLSSVPCHCCGSSPGGFRQSAAKETCHGA
jgi:methionyl-tRNA formyltransferase